MQAFYPTGQWDGRLAIVHAHAAHFRPIWAIVGDQPVSTVLAHPEFHNPMAAVAPEPAIGLGQAALLAQHCALEVGATFTPGRTNIDDASRWIADLGLRFRPPNLGVLTSAMGWARTLLRELFTPLGTAGAPTAPLILTVPDAAFRPTPPLDCMPWRILAGSRIQLRPPLVVVIHDTEVVIARVTHDAAARNLAALRTQTAVSGRNH